VSSQNNLQTEASGKRQLIADKGCPGLYGAVGGKRSSWILRYTDSNGRQRSKTIGDTSVVTLKEARDVVRKWRSELWLEKERHSHDPAPSTPVVTFQAFIEQRYRPHVQVSRRNYASEFSTIRKHFIPAFGKRALNEITRADILAFVHGKVAEGQAVATINKMLAFLRCIFNRAIEWEVGGIEKNPVRGVKPLPNPNRREIFLSREEAKRLLDVLSANSNKMLPLIVTFLLLTGCRKREALDARWEHVDLAKGVLTIPLSKSGKPRHVPLSPAAREVMLQARKLTTGIFTGDHAAQGWVFPNPRTGRPFVKMQTAWEKARHDAGLDGLHVHDLRHSFASALINEGRTLYDVKEALGHSNIVTTQRYAHLAPQRLMEAVSAAQDHYGLSTTPDQE